MEVRGTRIWGGRPIEDSEADSILNAVVDSGITFIDTANDYGKSEEYIGRFCRTGAMSLFSPPSAAAPSSTKTKTPTTRRTCGRATTCFAV
jgi:predicted aldo/keto reductase-like oxidoreductase